MTVLPQLERELLDAHGRLACRNRWMRGWLARRVLPAGATPAGPASRDRPSLGRGLEAVPVLFAVGLTMVAAVFALAALGHQHSNRNGPGATRPRAGVPTRRPAHPASSGTSGRRREDRSARAQAQELYAPVAVFDRSTTKAQRAQMRAAPKMDARRINACQRTASFNKLLMAAIRPGTTNAYKVYRIYENGLTLEDTQVAEAVVAPQLAVAERSWATMRLSNPIWRGVARALATEIAASLSAPKLNGCAFLHELARHKFSLAWTQRSAYATTATRFIHETNGPSYGVARGWQYVQKKHLLTSAQWSGIVNFPGIQG